MEAVQSIERTKKKSHDEDLGSYLDKLLRQEREQPESVSSAAAQEHHNVVLSTDRGDGSSHDDAKPAVWAADQTTVPVPETHAAWPKTSAGKRPKRVTRRKVRTKVRSRRKKPKNGRQIAMTILIPALAVTLLVLVRKPTEVSPAAAAATLDTVSVASAAVGEVEIDWEVPPAYQPGGRDPMRLAPPQIQHEEYVETRATVGERLDIKGLLYSDDRPAAIIGTRLLHEGEQIAGMTVIRIERDGVEFEMNGQRWKQTVSTTTDGLDRDTRQSVENGS